MIVTRASGDQFERWRPAWVLPVLGAVVLLAAVAGFVTWYFTRFVIDDEELRDRDRCDLQEVHEDPVRAPPVRRHHPAARRPDLRAGRATPRGRAETAPPSCAISAAARPLDSATICSPAPTGSRPASAISIRKQRRASSPISGAADQPLVQVPPQRLVVGFLLSSEWLISVAILIIVDHRDRRLRARPYALGGLIPLPIGVRHHDQSAGDLACSTSPWPSRRAVCGSPGA